MGSGRRRKEFEDEKILSLAIVFALGCKNDDPEPETKRAKYYDSIYHHFYDTTKVIDRYTDSIFHHFYDTLSVYDTVRVPILCDHSYVVYVLNNGTDEKDSLYIKNGATITLKSDVIRSGYDLVKWSTSPNGGGNDYQVGDDYYVNDDITLYAMWQSRDGLRSNEVYDFLAKQEAGSTVDIKIIDIYPDFNAIETALKKFWKVNVNVDLGDATEVTYLQRNFSYCTNLKTIILPPNVGHINDAFEGCSELTKLDLPLSVRELNLSNLQNLNTLIIQDGVTTLHYIRNCPKLTSINVPHSVTTMGDYGDAFIGNSSLTEITIPAGVECANLDFKNCTNLKTVKHSLKECSYVDFSYCKSLTSITIPEGVTSIGGSAFSYCTSLTSITIPETVTQIYGNASLNVQA